MFRTKAAKEPKQSRRMFSYFGFFFVSGFCGILYELIWLRLAMAQFGVTTALVSIVLSSFMAGLGVGSIAAGRLLGRYGTKIKFPTLRLYALAELLIACSAIAVPAELIAGHRLLSHLVSAITFSSGTYYVISGVWVALTLVPWCACMGATIPLAMFAVKNEAHAESEHSFSFLYFSNVLGAALGAVLPLLLIELRGFHSTLLIGAVLNCSIAITASTLTVARKARSILFSPEKKLFAAPKYDRWQLVLLFMTGLTSMGMEVVWIRMFTPFVSVMVYSFAAILLSYLTATFVGSCVYRDSAHRNNPESPITWGSLSLLAVLPLLTCDPRLHLNVLLRLILGIAPFAAAVGYLTPKLVDKWSGGDPDQAGDAYAINVLGCILGPLLSGFILLPWCSERATLLLFALPWPLVGFVHALRSHPSFKTKRFFPPLVFGTLALVLLIASESFESVFPKREVLRDNTATVLATGDGMEKRLFVNGVGMTVLTPITKVMAHLPLAFLNRPPQSALVVCFGMGTTFRSLLSWHISTTAVELVPSVPKMFWYYHPDSPQLLASPLSNIVIDDGRRFLERTSEKYDLITIDPPPPVEAAASSLLYSRQFYAAAKKHLRSDGILQQWLPGGDLVVRSSVAQALRESFFYVRVFHSLNQEGYHFLASDWSLPPGNARDLALRLPPSAAQDFAEWGPAPTAEGQFEILLRNEIPVDQLIFQSPRAPVLDDDRPTNEYFAWRLIRHDSSGSTERGGLNPRHEDTGVR
jgi:spermidine synthase